MSQKLGELPQSPGLQTRITLGQMVDKLNIGAHVSIAGGLALAIDRALEIEASVAQIFVKSNSRWVGKDLTEEEAASFRSKHRLSPLGSFVAHASYLINLASPRHGLWLQSIDAMIDELNRCRRLAVEQLVFHPGAHRGLGEPEGIRRVGKALDRIIEQTDPSVRLVLETTAGQGTSVGYCFEHLRDIIGLCASSDRLSVCLDTCHVFAAGYDLRTKHAYQETIGRFDRVLGLEKLSVIHLNDSKRELASCVDRHEHIGKGQIGSEGFQHLMADHRLAEVPKILETPKERGNLADKKNLKILRLLAKRGRLALRNGEAATFDNQDGTGSVVGNLAGDAPQKESLDSTATLVSQHDEI